MKLVNMKFHLYSNMLYGFAVLMICFSANLVYAGEELEIFRDCEDCPEMVALPDKGIAIGKYEVTFDEWDVCLADGGCNGYKPGEGKKSEAWGRGSRPATYISWEDAQSYIQWLSNKTGKNYRLPSEDEWEYACYGEKETKYCGGNDIKALGWFEENSGDQTHPVGEKKPNERGIHDMSGNLWEWTSDCVQGDCTIHKIRGGGWSYGAQLVQAKVSLRFLGTMRSYAYGFRLARSLQ